MILAKYILTCLMFIVSSSVFALDYELPDDEWRLISLPAAPPENANTVEAIISDDIFAVDASAAYGEKWALFSYNRTLNKYEKLTFNGVLEQGQGYWIIQKTGQAVTLDLPVNSVDTASNFDVNLTPVQGDKTLQWNLIGNPFATSKKLSDFSVKTNTGACSDSTCSLDRAETEKIVHNVVWSYSGSNYKSIENGQALNAWEGFWAVSLDNSKGLTKLSLVSNDTEGPEHKVHTKEEASAFLSRATFGATHGEIQALVTLGDYDPWFETQFAQEPSLHLSWAETHAKGINGVGDLKNSPADWYNYSESLTLLQRDAWWDIVVNGADQLRQRVAYALSEILVISRLGPLVDSADARMSYYDVLVRNAFGNFEDLLREVTYHPAMGVYLSYYNNYKANGNRHPDENYAREVMELFTIGLYELNLDGTQKLAAGEPIQTYQQDDIGEMAKVFTGLTDKNGFFFDLDGASHTSRIEPMIAKEERHDTTEKQILNQTITAGGETKADINQALHLLFMHQNTGPFIARRLIQRLVTSNPTPGYIQRVATAFNNNGNGQRGDMKAVVKAILLDDEALTGIQNQAQTFGKFREPLLFVSHLFRAFHAQNAEHTLSHEGKNLYRYNSFNFNGTERTKQEGPLEALTVFNYYTPDDAPWDLKKAGLFAPELELYGTQGIHEVVMGLINKDGPIYRDPDVSAELQLETEKAFLATDQYDELVSHLDTVLTGGRMSDATKSAITHYAQQHTELEDDKLVRHVIGLVVTSPDYALQR